MTEELTGRHRGACLALLLACFAYLALGNDGRHHWHEWRYAYSAVHYSIPELVAGAFDPGPPPERSAAEVGAWYWGQIFHEVLLSTIFRMTGVGSAGLQAAQWLYAAWFPLAVACWYAALRRLPIASDVRGIGAILLVSPLGCWMGFKLMAEPPAFFFASAGALCTVLAMRARSRVAAACSVGGAGLCLALSFVTMVYMPLTLLGLLGALVVVPPQDLGRTRAALVALAVVTVFTLVALALMRVFGLTVGDYVLMNGFYHIFRKSWLVSAFGLATAWSALYAVLPISLATPMRRDLRLFLVWTGLALGPLVISSSNYIEARFAVVALVPVAGLLWLAFRWLVSACARGRSERVVDGWSALVGVAVTVAITAATLPLMPFEMNSRELSRLVASLYARHPDAVLLLPWNYTDYHFLRLAYPDRDILLVQSPVDEEGRPFKDPAWERLRRDTYGRDFVADAAGLDAATGRPLLYLGHGRLPPFQNLQAVADAIGLRFVAERLAAMNPMVHIEQSWMWNNPAFHFTEVAKSRWYRVYRVEPAPALGRHSGAD